MQNTKRQELFAAIRVAAVCALATSYASAVQVTAGTATGIGGDFIIDSSDNPGTPPYLYQFVDASSPTGEGTDNRIHIVLDLGTVQKVDKIFNINRLGTISPWYANAATVEVKVADEAAPGFDPTLVSSYVTSTYNGDFSPASANAGAAQAADLTGTYARRYFLIDYLANYQAGNNINGVLNDDRDRVQLSDLQVELNPSAVPSWGVDASGDWNSGSNWQVGVPNAVDETALLLAVNTFSKTIFSESAVTVGTLRFDSANTYQIAGNGSLNIDVSTGNGSILVGSGNHKINLPLFIQDNTVADVSAGATLRISDPMTLVGGSTLAKIGDGSLIFESTVANTAPATIVSAAGVTSALMDLGSNTSVQVGGGTTNLKSTQHIASLSVTGGTVNVGPGTGVVIATKSLSISGTGKVDLQNSKLIVDYTGTSALAAVKTAIGTGSLTSSQLSAGRVIGYGEASDLFAGPTGSFASETVDSTSVVAAFTIVADASLDGTVNSADFNLLAGHYGQTTGSRWTQGDFDGDGKVNTLDFNVLAGNFGQSLPASASLGSVVPEPASAALVAAGFALALRRRRI